MNNAMQAMLLVLAIGATLALAGFTIGLFKDVFYPKWYDSGLCTRLGNLFFGLLMAVGVVLLCVVIYQGVITGA